MPAERITNAQPGELFVHRNIANLYTSDDGNTSSVIEYAVHALKVEQLERDGAQLTQKVQALEGENALLRRVTAVA